VPRILFLLVDGVGLGEADAGWNPFLHARLPVLREMLGGRPVVRTATPVEGPLASLAGMDALLGVEGIPQSGTGQASLLTGVNAAAMHGRHFGPWVPVRQQRMVREESILAVARGAGFRVAFANAYPEELVAAGSAPVVAGSVEPPADRRERRRRRAPSFLRAGPPLAALGAGVLTRHTEALRRGEAVASEIVNDGWRDVLGREALPEVDPATAGGNLALIAGAHDLTLFAHYATDYAGHRSDMAAAVQALERLDAFLGGVMAGLGSDAMLFMVSDHGNIEDVRVGHTRNPALALVAGRGHALAARRLRALTDVAPCISDLLAI
jgi:2,3-bisphosphoglycerate-independent phosphoglycerate mutase